MSKTNSPNTQEEFLKHASENKLNVLIFLVNGIKLSGKIIDFDQYSIALNNASINEHNSVLIFKHAISTIVPQRDVSSLIE
jgi:host factor-I protein